MSRDEAINYLISSGMSQEQIDTVEDAITHDEIIKERIRKECFILGKTTPDRIYELIKNATVWEICEFMCDMNNVIFDIWEVINNDA